MLCHSFLNLTQLIDDIKLILKKSYGNIVSVLLRFLSGREIHLKHRSLYNNFFLKLPYKEIHKTSH